VLVVSRVAFLRLAEPLKSTAPYLPGEGYGAGGGPAGAPPQAGATLAHLPARRPRVISAARCSRGASLLPYNVCQAGTPLPAP